jgi:bacteriocin biosynthesis cyclodehydratase domain-containing protein
LPAPSSPTTWERPRIKRTTEQLHAPNGDLYLRRPSDTSDILIEDPSRELRELLAALDGTRTRAELNKAFGEKQVENLVTELGELGLGEDASDDELIAPDKRARFDRQLRYFSDIASDQTPSVCQGKLEDARIAVLGVGGLGGWSALALSCCGIGEMLLVDFDTVEISNLNRQVLYEEDDIGQPKAKLAADRLRGFNSAMRVEVLEERLDSEAAVAAAIDGYDLVVNAVDWPAHDIELWVNSACFASGIPYIAMSHYPPNARVGPLYVPGETGCYSCQEIGYKRTYPLYDVAVDQQRAKPSPAATLGPACALISGQVSVDVMHHLTGLAKPSTFGVSHLYDLRTMEVTQEPVVPETECGVCGCEPLVDGRPEPSGATRASEPHRGSRPQ